MVRQPAQYRQQAGLTGSDLAEQQYEFARLDREVDPDHSAGTVVVDGRHVAKL